MDSPPPSPARPFLKWAGGKTQLLPQFERFFPDELKQGHLTIYVEPFVGGGAVFFHIAQKYPLREVHLCDGNPDLCLVYTVIQREPRKLVAACDRLQSSYDPLTPARRKKFFYRMRSEFNASRTSVDYSRYCSSWVERASQILFLNKTCFNGLYRTNSSGEFNVPFGDYKKPKFADANNIMKVSKLLRTATIHTGDFEICAGFVNDSSFVYFDPPYRPLNRTSSFTAYHRIPFNDNEQRRLAAFFSRLDNTTGARLMLSNSDPKNIRPDDAFFDDVYADFHIHRIPASRMINSNGAGRGKINELLILNYER